MRLVHTVEGADSVRAVGTSRRPSGPAMPPEAIEGCDKMEVWGTGFQDPGPDFCEFRFFRSGVLVATGRVDGY